MSLNIRSGLDSKKLELKSKAWQTREASASGSSLFQQKLEKILGSKAARENKKEQTNPAASILAKGDAGPQTSRCRNSYFEKIRDAAHLDPGSADFGLRLFAVEVGEQLKVLELVRRLYRAPTAPNIKLPCSSHGRTVFVDLDETLVHTEPQTQSSAYDAVVELRPADRPPEVDCSLTTAGRSEVQTAPAHFPREDRKEGRAHSLHGRDSRLRRQGSRSHRPVPTHFQPSPVPRQLCRARGR